VFEQGNVLGPLGQEDGKFMWNVAGKAFTKRPHEKIEKEGAGSNVSGRTECVSKAWFFCTLV
jgi:hypothetical protein